MKKRWICSAAAVAISTMATQCAYAQSSVTLYGIIEVGITYFSNLNGHGTFVANDGSIEWNRWGFVGGVDLGGRRIIKKNDQHKFPAGTFKGKILLVGAFATGIGDLRSTRLGAINYP